MEPWVCQSRRIEAGTKELSNCVPSCVPADLIECNAVATAMDLKGDLPAPADGHFFGCEMVEFVGARVGRTSDGSVLQAGRRPQRTSWQHTKIDACIGYT